jgi:hypothetical protein
MAESKDVMVNDLFGNKIAISSERWRHILEQHPELEIYFDEIKRTLSEPDVIKLSVSDKLVRMYYKFFSSLFGGKYILVVVKMNKRNFLVTAYVTDYIKTGEEIWKKRN